MTDDSPRLIQKLRLQRGWSLEQLAELTGLSVRTIQRVERGQNPSAESLKAIAAVLDVDFGALREAHMTPSVNQAVNADEALALARVRKIKGFLPWLLLGWLARASLGAGPRAARDAGLRQDPVPERRLGTAGRRKIPWPEIVEA
jgi:transcriptional regulator with XRE-family HTH domain